MPDSSVIPVSRVDEPRQPKVKAHVNGADPSPLPSVSPAGPRKLIRPQLPAGAQPRRYAGRLSAVAPRPTLADSARPLGASSHAEAFYLQKQIQSQTLMVFVLEDGEHIEGQIEWYDRDAIKLRHGGGRTLIYKSSIKYLHKAGDGARP